MRPSERAAGMNELSRQDVSYSKLVDRKGRRKTHSNPGGFGLFVVRLNPFLRLASISGADLSEVRCENTS